MLFIFFLINCVHGKVLFASQMGCVFDSGWDCARTGQNRPATATGPATNPGLAAFRWRWLRWAASVVGKHRTEGGRREEGGVTAAAAAFAGLHCSTAREAQVALNEQRR